MSYVLANAAHCWELFAFRTRLVAFMSFTTVAHASRLGETMITTAASGILLLACWRASWATNWRSASGAGRC